MHEPFPNFDQDRGRYFAERRNHSDLSDGTRKAENATAFKRGAATVALHAWVSLVPTFYEGPKNMRMGHMIRQPRIRVTFGVPIPTTEVPLGRATTFACICQLEAAITKLKPTVTSDPSPLLSHNALPDAIVESGL